MTAARSEKGFTLIELMISLVILLLSLSALATMLLQNARLNRAQQMALQTQADARNCLSMIVPVLRTAGWDPQNAGIATVTVDPSGNEAEVFADINEDGDTGDSEEDVTVRFQSNRLEWKKTSAAPFVTLSEDITNDADGDGTAEAMFTADNPANPTRITVKITARSPVPDPRNGQYIRYTASTDVILRDNL